MKYIHFVTFNTFICLDIIPVGISVKLLSCLGIILFQYSISHSFFPISPNKISYRSLSWLIFHDPKPNCFHFQLHFVLLIYPDKANALGPSSTTCYVLWSPCSPWSWLPVFVNICTCSSSWKVSYLCKVGGWIQHILAHQSFFHHLTLINTIHKRIFTLSLLYLCFQKIFSRFFSTSREPLYNPCYPWIHDPPAYPSLNIHLLLPPKFWSIRYMLWYLDFSFLKP